MSKALKCDRCGKLYEIYDGIAINEGGNKYNEMSLQRPWNPISREYDLCPECMKSLFEWLKEADKE